MRQYLFPYILFSRFLPAEAIKTNVVQLAVDRFYLLRYAPKKIIGLRAWSSQGYTTQPSLVFFKNVSLVVVVALIIKLSDLLWKRCGCFAHQGPNIKVLVELLFTQVLAIGHSLGLGNFRWASCLDYYRTQLLLLDFARYKQVQFSSFSKLIERLSGHCCCRMLILVIEPPREFYLLFRPARLRKFGFGWYLIGKKSLS